MKTYGDPVWEQLFSSQAWGKYPSEEAVRFFFAARRLLGETAPRTLDLGCGKGALSWFLAREGARVTAMDGAPAGLENVPRLAAEFGVAAPIATVLGDITAPAAFVAPGFDLVIDHYSLCSNAKSKIAAACRQVWQLLRPGGLFLTCTFGSNTDGCGTGTELEPGSYSGEVEGPLAHRGTISFFSGEELQQFLTEAGFKIEYTEAITQEKNGVRIEKLLGCVRKP